MRIVFAVLDTLKLREILYTCSGQLAADLQQILLLFVLRLFLDRPSSIRKDERVVHVILVIRDKFQQEHKAEKENSVSEDAS